jgi:hypothetical protein
MRLVMRMRSAHGNRHPQLRGAAVPRFAPGVCKALLLATAVLFAAPSVAQPTVQTPTPLSDTAAKRAGERVERHIADLHRRLAITPAQEPLWAAFADVMRANAKAVEQNFRDRQAHGGALTAVEDMRNYAAATRLHADNVEQLLPPFERLYNAMSQDQRRVTDQTFQSFKRGAEKAGRL